jgi:hypothetical protein
VTVAVDPRHLRDQFGEVGELTVAEGVMDAEYVVDDGVDAGAEQRRAGSGGRVDAAQFGHDEIEICACRRARLVEGHGAMAAVVDAEAIEDDRPGRVLGHQLTNRTAMEERFPAGPADLPLGDRPLGDRPLGARWCRDPRVHGLVLRDQPQRGAGRLTAHREPPASRRSAQPGATPGRELGPCCPFAQ